MKVNFIVEDFLFFKYVGCATAAKMLFSELNTFGDLTLLWNSKDKECDLVHFHTFGPMALLYKKLSGGIKVITAHSTPRLNEKNLAFSSVINAFYPSIYRSFDHIIAISERCRGEVIEMAPAVPCTLIPNGIDISPFHRYPERRIRFRKRFSIKDDQRVVLTVAQQTPRKGIFDFLDVAQKCPDVMWVWVGGFPYSFFSKEFSRIQKMKRSSRANVIFSGFIPDITEAYNGADIFFMPSFAEGMSIVLLEAMANELPCIVRDIPEFREIFKDDGLYFKTIDEVATIVSNQERLQKVVSLSKRLVHNYDIHRIAERHRILYKELINR